MGIAYRRLRYAHAKQMFVVGRKISTNRGKAHLAHLDDEATGEDESAGGGIK